VIMATEGGSKAELFASLCEEFAGTPGVTLPDGGRGFGSSALKINRSIFAMLVDDQLVVKLPRARVNELIETGQGLPFDAGKGKPMKEWIRLVADEDTCRRLVAEALKFVGR
jgi:hypothetical protein